jgi:hypothetical protein
MRSMRFENILNDTFYYEKKLRIKDIYFGYAYDGSVYYTSVNTTYSNYLVPKGCYHSVNNFDTRCRYWLL